MAWFGGFTLETYNRIPGDYEILTVGTAVVNLTATKIKPSTIIRSLAENIRENFCPKNLFIFSFFIRSETLYKYWQLRVL